MTEQMVATIRDIFDELPSDVLSLSLDKVYAALLVKLGPVDMARLKSVIRELVENEVLVPYGSADEYRLKGSSDANAPYQMTIFDQISMISRDQIERESRSRKDLYLDEELEREQTSRSVLQDIAAGHAQESAFALEIRKAAVLLAREDPIELILEMAQWVIGDLNDLAAKCAIAAATNAKDVDQIVREIDFRRTKAIRFFQRLWRLDTSTDGVGGIMFIPTIYQFTKKNAVKATVDLLKARERLEQRVIGKCVIEVVSMPTNNHRGAIGTDASVGDVQVKHREGSFIPPTPAVLFVASAALHARVNDTILPYWDFDIDPRDLEKYEDVEAAEQGLLISPKLRREAITDFRHLRSAAMELRQYMEESRVLERKADWRPIAGITALDYPPEPSLLIRDGRIFPLVHRIDDYDGASAPDDMLYGTIVRREIKAFHSVFQKSAGLNRLGPVYSGAVKSPEFSWLAMMTFWYLYVRCNKKEMADGFYRPILNDQAVTHLLFWGLAENDRTLLADPRGVFLTFRTIRRYSDIAFDNHPLVILNTSGKVERLVDENNEDDWLAYIEQHMKDANDRYYTLHKRGVPSLGTIEAYGPFLDLCRRSGVAMFYGTPTRMYHPVIESHAHFLCPRWEIALDTTSLNAQNLDEKVKKMFSWLVDEGGLVRDQTHSSSDFDEPEQGLPLFVPDVVRQAHETVAFARDRHVPDLQERLRQLISEIQERTARTL